MAGLRGCRMRRAAVSRPPHVIEWSAFGGHLAAQVDATYRSKIYYDPRNVERLSDRERTFVDGRLGWTTAGGNFEFGVWGRNLFDETNISDIIPIEGLGFGLFSMARRAPPACTLDITTETKDPGDYGGLDRNVPERRTDRCESVRRRQRHTDRWFAAAASRRTGS